MAPKSSKNQFRVVRADELQVHPVAQRHLVTSHLNRVMLALDLDAIGTLHVVEKNDRLWIVDGQHRWTALMRHGFGEWKVRVEIHVDAKDDDARASALFLLLNQRAVVGPYDKFTNELASLDPVAVNTDKITKSRGYEVHRVVGDGRILCVTALKAIYKMDEGQTLDETLSIVTEAWGHTRDAVEGKLLEGLAEIVAKYNGELDRPALIKKLAKAPGGPMGILGDAKGLKRIRRGALPYCVAEIIAERYNAGRRIGRIEV